MCIGFDTSVFEAVIRGTQSRYLVQNLYLSNMFKFWKCIFGTLKIGIWRFHVIRKRSIRPFLSCKMLPLLNIIISNYVDFPFHVFHIATQERKICDVEIEIVTFVINGSVKLTDTPDRQK